MDQAIMVEAVTPVPTELEKTQDRLRAAEVVIMALYHRIERLEGLMKQHNWYIERSENRELKYDTDGLRFVVKDPESWE